MADISSLTDNQIEALLERAEYDSEARILGFVWGGDPVRSYGFIKDAPDWCTGYHASGDLVTRDWFRLAVKELRKSRGSLLGDEPRVVRAYWDTVRNDPSEWSNETVLTLACVAPFLGVMQDMVDSGWGD
jgi:hypothetical protein